jgi:hypothetical protein
VWPPFRHSEGAIYPPRRHRVRQRSSRDRLLGLNLPGGPDAIMVAVDRYEGHCRLDWWANPVTLLGSIDVSLVITAQGSEWEAHGRLANEEDQEEFAFFCDLDPVFTLRFDDYSTIAVTVHPTDGHRRFRLNEYTEPVTTLATRP